jgi:O-antigen ligase
MSSFAHAPAPTLGSPWARVEALRPVVRVAVIWVLPWFVFVPFVELPGLPVSLDDLLPVIVVGAGLLLRFAGGRPRFEPVTWGLILLAVLNLVATVSAGGTDHDLVRSAARGFGRFLFYAGLVNTVAGVIRNRHDVERMLTSIVIGAVVQGLFCLWAYATGYSGPYGIGVAPTPIWTSLRRVHGTFASGTSLAGGSPVSANFLSAYLMAAAVLAGGLALRTGRWLGRGASLAAIGICVAGIGVSFSRSSLVAVGVGLALVALLSRRFWLVGAAVILAVLTLAAVPGLRERLSSVDSNRRALYAAGMRVVEDNPLCGVGDGNYLKILNSSARYQLPPEGVAVATPHNSVLLAAAHAGVFAGLLLAIIVFLVIGRMLLLSLWLEEPLARTLAAALAAAAIGFWIQDQVNSLLFVPKTASWFWILAGLSLVLGRGVTPARRPRAAPAPPPPPSSR